jgi:hypothetical protein
MIPDIRLQNLKTTVLSFFKDVADETSSMINAFFNVFSWRLVRAYGALTILTRASYAMLVIVPLLAGAWPAVQTLVNASEQRLVNVSDRLTKSAERLSGSACQLEIRRGDTDSSVGTANREKVEDNACVKRTSKVLSEAEQLSDKIRQIHDSQSSYMPVAWGLAFFAALAVALGQAIYQTSAPEIVRRYTLEEYQEFRSIPKGREPTADEVNYARQLMRHAEFSQGTFLNKKVVACLKAAFECAFVFEAVLQQKYGLDLNQVVQNPKLTSQDEMKGAAESKDVQAAIYSARRALQQEGTFYARECLELLQDTAIFEVLLALTRRSSVLPSQDVDLRPKYSETTSYLAQHHLLRPFDQDGAATAHNRERVWIGARVEYLDQSRKKARARCLLSLALYFIATLLVVWITYTQARSVAEAVGWTPVASGKHSPLEQSQGQP